ncbi:MAG: recombinase family protein [Candidatus Dormibacteraeota bacterium]|nr:recombinase family protein [Candidatus Dormibacteraeota bacterium]
MALPASAARAAPGVRPGMRAAMYLRISSDPGHDELGVKRQEKACREMCERLGLRLGSRPYTDDDRSAFSGKPRKQYRALMEAVEMGDVDAIVGWHPDRLHRSPAELEAFIDLLERTGTTVVTVQEGEYDLSTSGGRMKARVVGAVARHESEVKSERLKLKMRELRERRRAMGGLGHRNFGYEPYVKGSHRFVVRPEEADIIRELAEMYLAGSSFRELVRELTRRGVPTVEGRPWDPNTVRQILVSPHIAGLRRFEGQLIPGVHPAVIDVETHHRLVQRVEQERKRRPRQRAVRRFVLTGVVTCGNCGKPLVGRTFTTKTGKAAPSYFCDSSQGGCGKVSVLAEPVEELVARFVMEAVDDPSFASRVAEAEGPRTDLDTVRRDLEERAAELAQMWADGELDRAAWKAARDRLSERLSGLEQQEEALPSPGPLERWRERSLAEAWPTLGLDQRRAIIGALIERVPIMPVGKGGARRFNPERVGEPVWRL